MLRTVLEKASQDDSKDLVSRLNILSSMMDGSLLIYNCLKVKLSSTQEPYMELLKASLSLVLFAVGYFNTLCHDDKGYGKVERVTTTLGKLESSLKDWVSDARVIGGSVFGGSVNPNSWRAKKEIQVGTHNIMTL